MTIRHLRIFVAITETGSATAAGKKLKIAQPSISLAISELEEYYGIKLFDRIAKRLHITDAGKNFLQYATHIVSLFEDMEKEVKNIDELGVLHIGASITIGNYLLPQYIIDFNKIHPQLDVKVTIEDSARIQEYVLTNQIDIGMVEGKVHNPNIIKKQFTDDHLVMICPIDHQFANKKNILLAQLRDEKFLLREKGSAVRELFDNIMSVHGLEVEISWESISTQAIVRAVKSNLGISLLPYMLVKDALDRNEISQFSVKGIKLDRQFSIIYHQNKFLTRGAKDFIKLCK